MLAQQIRHHSASLDCIIVFHLTDIALAGSPHSFNDIVQVLGNLVKNAAATDRKAISKELSQAVSKIYQLSFVYNVTTPKREYLTFVLTSFLLCVFLTRRLSSVSRVWRRLLTADQSFITHSWSAC